jgi:hypothetical protein
MTGSPALALWRDLCRSGTRCAALSVRARYASLDLDLVDAVNVALAAEYDTDAVLTRDIRDFRTVRPLGSRHTHFRILPDDL